MAPPREEGSAFIRKEYGLMDFLQGCAVVGEHGDASAEQPPQVNARPPAALRAHVRMRLRAGHRHAHARGPGRRSRSTHSLLFYYCSDYTGGQWGSAGHPLHRRGSLVTKSTPPPPRARVGS